MSCPGDIDKVVEKFRKATTELTNEEIMELAGGKDGDWGTYLKGPRVQAIVRHANIVLAQENYEVVSSGINTGRWRMVTCAEARAEQARQQTAKATNHVRNAEANMWMVVKDERAPGKLRLDAAAWLQLFHDEKDGRNLLVFEQWANELVKKLPAPQRPSVH